MGVDFESGKIRQLAKDTVISGEQHIPFIALIFRRQRHTFVLSLGIIHLKGLKLLNLAE